MGCIDKPDREPVPVAVMDGANPQEVIDLKESVERDYAAYKAKSSYKEKLRSLYLKRQDILRQDFVGQKVFDQAVTKKDLEERFTKSTETLEKDIRDKEAVVKNILANLLNYISQADVEEINAKLSKSVTKMLNKEAPVVRPE